MDRKGPAPQQLPIQQQQVGIASRRLPAAPLLAQPPRLRGTSPSAGAVATVSAAPPPQPLSPSQVIALVRDARSRALAGGDSHPAEAPGGALNPGITLDLIGKSIPSLPDEVVDILRQGVERCVLEHPSL